MYENLTFGELKSAQRTNGDEVTDIEDATIEHQSDRMAEKLHISNIGEGALNSVFVDLVKGELKATKKKRTVPEFGIEDSNIEVDDDEMTITIDRGFEVVTLVVECEGDVSDDDGPDLDRFGVDI
jgi:hypothetical protein